MSNNGPAGVATRQAEIATVLGGRRLRVRVPDRQESTELRENPTEEPLSCEHGDVRV